MSSSSSSSKAIRLKEWVNCALDSVDVSSSAGNNEAFTSCMYGSDPSSWPTDTKRSLAVSSNVYLSSALVVARSLANQICLAEAEGGEAAAQQDQQFFQNGGQQTSSLPSPGPNWADQVSVHVASSSSSQQDQNNVNGVDNVDVDVDGYEGDLQPLPFSPRGSASPRELQDMLNSLIPDQSLYTKEDPISYLSVAGAELQSFMNTNNGIVNNVRINPRDEMQRIYSLGLVFYELFSGGESHPDISVNGFKSSYPQSEELVDDTPLPLDAGIDSSTFFDLGGELNILDDIEDDIGSAANKGFLDLVKGLDEVENFEEQEEPRNRKKKSIQGSSSLQSSSILTVGEQLKMKGLPVALCDLIGNMIDCANGDLSGEEAYCSMSDVRTDLQLMMDQPRRFLDDLDIKKLSVTGLPLNDVQLGREMDLSMLQGAYRRSISGKNEMAIISGPSGVGKSVLANQLGSYVTSTGGLFFSGKFDKVQQTIPFSALASAFNQYCNAMLMERQNNLQEVASKLRAALGSEAHHLVKVIPNLSALLGEHAAKSSDDQDCVDGQKRLQYLMCKFVDVICTYSGAPIILFLDDLQWADPSSIGALHQLMMPSESFNSKRQFFFLGSCREEGLLDEHPLGQMLSDLTQLGLQATLAQLACMDKDMTNKLVSELLCLSPRLTMTLSDVIYHKTKGNPLFFAKLITSLCKEGLVRLSLSRRRWEWDDEKIQSRKLPDDVAAFMTDAIAQLPQVVQNALCALSCFGASAECAIIQALEETLKSPLIEPLDLAVAEGLLDKVGDTYSFSHDKLQESAYSMINPAERCLFHFKYGVALVPRALGLQDDGLLFVAATQINQGGPKAVEDAEQGVLIANLNLNAGQKAIEMSDFSSALSFFDNGISFLRKRHWQEQYDLSMKLFNSANKCALITGDLVTLKLLSEQIMTFAESFEDKLDAMYNTVCALAYASQIPKSVDRSISILAQLGEELPQSFSESDTKQLIEQTKVMLQGFTDDQLIEYKMMEDPAKKAAMKFFGKLEVSLKQIKPDLQPIVTLKMVQLSIAHGMSPFSPLGFVYFGQLVAKLGDIQEGCRYVKIARKQLKSFGSKEVAGELTAVGNQLMCFVEPMQATQELHVTQQADAFAAGDTHGVTFHSVLYVATSFWSGTKLPVCSERLSRAHRLLSESGQENFLAHILQLERTALTLIGSDAADSIANSLTDDEKEFQLHKVNPHAAMSYYFQKLFLVFLLRDYDQTKFCAEKYFENAGGWSWSLYVLVSAHKFYIGLTSFWIYRESNDTKWAERGCECKAAMKKWAQYSQHNFLQCACLLEAEEAFSYNDFDLAEALYQKAILSSRNHRFINIEALACESAGYFYLKLDKKDTAIQYFMQAHEKYHEWGAIAKSNALFGFVQQTMMGHGNDVFNVPSPSPLPLINQNEQNESSNQARKRGSDWSN